MKAHEYAVMDAMCGDVDAMEYFNTYPNERDKLPSESLKKAYEDSDKNAECENES